MTVKNIFRLLFFISLYSCSDIYDEVATKAIQQQLELNIENDPRQGFQYFDSTQEYNYRNYTITIANDTTIPIKLSFGFKKSEMRLSDTSYSRIFLLPRHLTPKQQQFDTHGISKELKYFLDHDVDKPVRLDKIINPTEKCVLTFGVLTAVKFPDPTTPFGTTLLTINENSSERSFKLKINNSLIVPCGQFSYIDK